MNDQMTMVRRFIQPKDINHDGKIVPINYYGKDSNEDPTNYASSSVGIQEASLMIPEGKYRMDHNTLWIIANRMARLVRP